MATYTFTDQQIKDMAAAFPHAQLVLKQMFPNVFVPPQPEVDPSANLILFRFGPFTNITIVRDSEIPEGFLLDDRVDWKIKMNGRDEILIPSLKGR